MAFSSASEFGLDDRRPFDRPQRQQNAQQSTVSNAQLLYGDLGLSTPGLIQTSSPSASWSQENSNWLDAESELFQNFVSPPSFHNNQTSASHLVDSPSRPHTQKINFDQYEKLDFDQDKSSSASLGVPDSDSDPKLSDVRLLAEAVVEKKTRLNKTGEVVKQRQEAARRKLKEDYDSIRKKLEEIRGLQEREIDQLIEEDSRELDRAGARIDTMIIQLSEYTKTLQSVRLENDSLDKEARTLELLTKITGLREDFDNIERETSCMFGRTINMELFPNSRFTRLTECLNEGPVHYLKVLPQHPRDVMLTLAPGSRLVVGQGVSVEIRAGSRCDEKLASLLFCDVKDERGTSIAREVQPKIGDTKTLIITFVPRGSGVYKLDVTLYEEHVRNSPFTMKVESAADLSISSGPTESLSFTGTSESSFRDLSSEILGISASGRSSGLDRLTLTESPVVSATESAMSAFHPVPKTRTPNLSLTRPSSTLTYQRPPATLAAATPLSIDDPAGQEAVGPSWGYQSEESSAAATSSPIVERGNGKPNLAKMYQSKKGIMGKYLFSIGKYEKCYPPLSTLRGPIGCAVITSSDAMVICDTSHHAVKIFRKNGSPLRLIGPNEPEPVVLDKPSATVVFPGPNGEEWLAVKDDQCIWVFRLMLDKDGDLDAQFLRTLGSRELDKPKGLAVTEEGNLLTLTLCQKLGPQLFVFDPRKGDIVKRCSFDPPGHSTKLYFMHCTGDILIVADLGRNCVFLWSLSGAKCVKKFGGFGHGPGQFDWPTGVRTDGAGNILVGDAKNNRVQLFDSQGNVICVLNLERGAPHVSDIELTLDGRLLVMSREKHVVYVYQLMESL